MTMSNSTRQENLAAVKAKYRKANRNGKRRILDWLEEICGYHRKHAIRELNNRIKGRKASRRKRGRKGYYCTDVEFCAALRALWFRTEQMCAPNFHSAIPDWLLPFKEEYPISEAAYEKFLTVSAATVGRLLNPSKCRTKKRGGSKPGSLLRTEIPIRTDFWDATEPGYMEADTVAHCGGSMSGEFAWTLTATDIHTTWTEIRSVWHKRATGVLEMVKDIEAHLPFPLLAFDSDNGGEFINKALVHYFSGKFIPFTRSREYHKNDNGHVEQKNYTHVRQLLGYDRIDCQAVIPMLNDLFRNEVSLLRNHFYPCLKLAEKVKIKSRLVRKYPPPVTPYRRVLDCPSIPEATKEKLEALHATLNPLELQRVIKRKLKAIFAMVRQEHLKTKAS